MKEPTINQKSALESQLSSICLLPSGTDQRNHRAKMFIKRLKTVGMPERFAQQALGHSLKAFARAYSKKAKVIVPSLEDHERKIVPMPVAVNLLFRLPRVVLIG